LSAGSLGLVNCAWSERRLATLGRAVEFVVIAGGRHVFNFKQNT